MPNPSAQLAVIGGSGFYDMAGLSERQTWRAQTPFGNPSGTITIGNIEGKRVAFLPRHGEGHTLLPQEIPVKANIFALKILGVQGIIAVSAVGSLREEIAPLDMVVPDQIIDRTRQLRPTTFFGNGIVAHVSFADPFCPDLSTRLVTAGRSLGKTVHSGGTYVCMEGPLFSTRAESQIYRSWDAAIIGMTALPEAKLAREAEIAYAMLASATDYDVWHETEEDVTADLVIKRVAQNVKTAQEILKEVVRHIPSNWVSTAKGALANAIVTDPTMIPPTVKQDLAPIVGRYLP